MGSESLVHMQVRWVYKACTPLLKCQLCDAKKKKNAPMRNHVITFSACNVTNPSDVMASPGHRCLLEHMLLGDFMYIFCKVWEAFFCKKMLPSLHPNLKA